MNIILHDYHQHLTFAPLTLTRPVGNLRMGMWTNDERWKFYCPEATISFQTEDYLSKKFPTQQTDDNFWINAAVIPTKNIVEKIKHLGKDESMFLNGHFVAHRGREFLPNKHFSFHSDELIVIEHRWHLYQKNDFVLRTDFAAYTKGKQSPQLSETNTLLGDRKQLFIEEGAKVECAIINVKSGPVYIGKDAEIMEGSVIRGGLAMAPNSILKLATKVYGATSLGPYCKVGGEVNNVVFHGYSNKGHDGFLGNSIIGEWCNLGADTNCSNLKNNYGMVKTYNYQSQSFEQTDLQFMGVVMGDYSKTSINTMLNTATTVGVFANIFCGEFPPKYVSEFSWGGLFNSPFYDFKKAIESASRMMERRDIVMTLEEQEILRTIFDRFAH